MRPDLATAHHGLAIHWNTRRRFEDALQEIRKTIELDPLTPLFQAHLGWILHCSRRDEEALRVLQSALDLHPGDYYLLRILLYVCSTARRADLALEAREKIAGHTKNKQVVSCLSGFAYAAAREVEQARKMVHELLAQPKVDPGIAYYLALIQCMIGEKEEALKWLEKAAEEKLGILIVLGPEPAFDPLRSEPRFQALLHKLDLLE